MQADDLAMRTVALSQRRVNFDSMAQMVQMLEQAIAMDPDCVRAWGMLAFVLMHQLLNGWAADADDAATTRRIEAIVIAQSIPAIRIDGRADRSQPAATPT